MQAFVEHCSGSPPPSRLWMCRLEVWLLTGDGLLSPQRSEVVSNWQDCLAETLMAKACGFKRAPTQSRLLNISFALPEVSNSGIPTTLTSSNFVLHQTTCSPTSFKMSRYQNKNNPILAAKFKELIIQSFYKTLYQKTVQFRKYLMQCQYQFHFLNLNFHNHLNFKKKQSKQMVMNKNSHPSQCQFTNQHQHPQPAESTTTTNVWYDTWSITTAGSENTCSKTTPQTTFKNNTNSTTTTDTCFITKVTFFITTNGNFRWRSQLPECS